ncbi:Protein kinase C-binding protein 1 [Halotydeus destructor]|nr:Protein kinase C-binding protein 1 [Halotydeus destructor]
MEVQTIKVEEKEETERDSLQVDHIVGQDDVPLASGSEKQLQVPVADSLRSPLRRTSVGVVLNTDHHQSNNDNNENANHDHDEQNERQLSGGKDFHCWQCHKEKVNVECSRCPRSYHYKCLPSNSSSNSQDATNNNDEGWLCMECKNIAKSEHERKSSSNLGRVTEKDFCTLLKFALQTIKQTADATFHQPVTEVSFPDYKEFIVHPMDFQTIDRNIRKGHYKSTEGLVADVKWIVHNSYIYNSQSHSLTKNAQYFYKVAKNEMAEIEVCPDCFMNFYVYPRTWFVETCHKPHVLVFARLKGHPFWPAKAVRVDATKNEVDCRFFGAHDRAWVPYDSVVLMSETYAWNKPKGHKSKLDAALGEVKEHVQKLGEKFPGLHCYAQAKQPFNPNKTFLSECPDSEQGKAVAGNLDVGENAPEHKGEQVEKDEEEEKEEGDGEEKALVIVAPSLNETSTKKVKVDECEKQKTATKRKSSSTLKSTTPKSSSNKSNSSCLTNDNDLVDKRRRSSSSSDITAANEQLNNGKRKSEAKNSVSQAAGKKQKITSEKVVKIMAISATGDENEIHEKDLLQEQQGVEEVVRVKKEVEEELEKKSKTKAAPSPSQGSRSELREEEGVVVETVKIEIEQATSGENVSIVPSEDVAAAVVAPSLAVEVDEVDVHGTPAGTIPEKVVEADTSKEQNVELMKRVTELENEIASLKQQLTSKDDEHNLKVTTMMEDAERMVKAEKEAIERTNETLVANLSVKHKEEIELTKTKQWCAACFKEAIYFCCWNCSYCGYDCQSKHWPSHMAVCQQQNKTRTALEQAGNVSGPLNSVTPINTNPM